MSLFIEMPTSDLDIMLEIGAAGLFFIVTCLATCRLVGKHEGFRICAAGDVESDTSDGAEVDQ